MSELTQGENDKQKPSPLSYTIPVGYADGEKEDGNIDRQGNGGYDALGIKGHLGEQMKELTTARETRWVPLCRKPHARRQ